MPTTAVSAQRLAVKTNIAYGLAALTPNLAVEVALGSRSTLDVGAGYNPWNLEGDQNDNKKLVHWVASAEYRYWLCEKFNGHFFGAHVLGGSYNIGGHELPLLLGKGSRDYRHEGSAVGGGVSYGYHLVLGLHWNMEFSVGAGYLAMKHDRYDCPKCGTAVGSVKRKYFGPTRGGLSLAYTF